MHIDSVSFTQISWDTIAPTEHAGETGTAWWRTVEMGNLRVRMVEYSAGYSADHWCGRGHVLLVLRGELHTMLKDGRRFVTKAGESWQVGDGDGEHRSSTTSGVVLFIVD